MHKFAEKMNKSEIQNKTNIKTEMKNREIIPLTNRRWMWQPSTKKNYSSSASCNGNGNGNDTNKGWRFRNCWKYERWKSKWHLDARHLPLIHSIELFSRIFSLDISLFIFYSLFHLVLCSIGRHAYYYWCCCFECWIQGEFTFQSHMYLNVHDIQFAHPFYSRVISNRHQVELNIENILRKFTENHLV